MRACPSSACRLSACRERAIADSFRDRIPHERRGKGRMRHLQPFKPLPDIAVESQSMHVESQGAKQSGLDLTGSEVFIRIFEVENISTETSTFANRFGIRKNPNPEFLGCKANWAMRRQSKAR